MLKRVLFIFLLTLSLTVSLVSCNDVGAQGNDGNVPSDKDDNNGVEDAGDGKSDGDSDADGSDKSDDSASGDSDTSDGADNSVDNENTEDDSDANSGKEESGENDDSQPTVTYVYNLTSKKYHIPTCYHVGSMKVETKVEFSGTIEELSALGYSPCKSCKPDPNYDYDQSDDDGEESENENGGEGLDYMYVLNPDSKKFHLNGCASADSMNEENKQYSNESREELILQGYSPCGNCHP